MIHIVSMQKEGEKDAAVISKVHHGDNKKDDTATNTHTNTQNKEHPTHSKFKLQIQIAGNTPKVVSGAKKIAPRLLLLTFIV
jgi:hypothetical protein